MVFIDGVASKVKPTSVAAQRIRRPIMVASWWKVRRTGAEPPGLIGIDPVAPQG